MIQWKWGIVEENCGVSTPSNIKYKTMSFPNNSFLFPLLFDELRNNKAWKKQKEVFEDLWLSWRNSQVENITRIKYLIILIMFIYLKSFSISKAKKVWIFPLFSMMLLLFHLMLSCSCFVSLKINKIKLKSYKKDNKFIFWFVKNICIILWILSVCVCVVMFDVLVLYYFQSLFKFISYSYQFFQSFLVFSLWFHKSNIILFPIPVVHEFKMFHCHLMFLMLCTSDTKKTTVWKMFRSKLCYGIQGNKNNIPTILFLDKFNI